MEAAGQNVVLVLGVMPRVGTNFMRDLLCLHPRCQASVSPEDFLLPDSKLLLGYVAALERRFEIRDHFFDRDALTRALGVGLTAYLRRGADDPETIVVSKTPSVEGLIHAQELLPEATVLTVVRDARDVVVSGMRTFGWALDAAAWRYAAALRGLRAYKGPSALVRYERLLSPDPRGVMEALLDYVGAPSSAYPFDEMDKLPVRGSSAGTPRKIDWEPRAKPSDFKPVGRWREVLSTDEEERVWRIVGDEMEALGYER